MTWNWLVSALAVGVTVILCDGSSFISRTVWTSSGKGVIVMRSMQSGVSTGWVR